MSHPGQHPPVSQPSLAVLVTSVELANSNQELFTTTELFTTCSNHRYLKKRKDTVRCIVLALTEDYELFDLQGKESQEEARGEFVSSFQRVSLPLRCYSNCKLSESAVQRRQHNLSELRKIQTFQ